MEWILLRKLIIFVVELHYLHTVHQARYQSSIIWTFSSLNLPKSVVEKLHCRCIFGKSGNLYIRKTYTQHKAYALHITTILNFVRHSDVGFGFEGHFCSLFPRILRLLFLSVRNTIRICHHFMWLELGKQKRAKRGNMHRERERERARKIVCSEMERGKKTTDTVHMCSCSICEFHKSVWLSERTRATKCSFFSASPSSLFGLFCDFNFKLTLCWLVPFPTFAPSFSHTNTFGFIFVWVCFPHTWSIHWYECVFQW